MENEYPVADATAQPTRHETRVGTYTLIHLWQGRGSYQGRVHRKPSAKRGFPGEMIFTLAPLRMERGAVLFYCPAPLTFKEYIDILANFDRAEREIQP